MKSKPLTGCRPRMLDHSAAHWAAPSPFLPLPQHEEFDTKGGLRTFAADASLTLTFLGSGHSAGGEIECLFCSAPVRSEPKPEVTLADASTQSTEATAAPPKEKQPFGTLFDSLGVGAHNVRRMPTSRRKRLASLNMITSRTCKVVDLRLLFRDATTPPRSPRVDVAQHNGSGTAGEIPLPCRPPEQAFESRR